MVKKKRFKKVVEWKEGGIFLRIIFFVWIGVIILLCTAFWYPPQSLMMKIVFSIDVIVLFIGCCCRIKAIVYGKRRVYYREV